VLFVSHNMVAVKSFCRSVILLNNGRVLNISDNVDGVIKNYLTLEKQEGAQTGCWYNVNNNYRDIYFTPIKFQLVTNDGEIIDYPVSPEKKIWVEIICEIEEPDPSLTFGYALYDEAGELLYWSYNSDTAESTWPRIKKGINTIKSELPAHLLNEGKYRLEMIASLHFRRWILQPGTSDVQLFIEITGTMSKSPLWIARRPGVLAPVIQWRNV